MKSRLLALLAALLLAPVALADDTHAPVAPEIRSRNTTGVQCAWASLRTMALRAKYAKLAALCETKPGPLWNPNDIETACQSCGVAVERVGPGDQDRLWSFLEKHVQKGKRPAWIGVYGGRHALLCVHFERGKRVKLIGNSNLDVREFGWSEFLTQMQPDGLSFALPGDVTGGKGQPVEMPPPKPAQSYYLPPVQYVWPANCWT